MKKAQGLTLNTIVIAALVLVVLIIAIMAFRGGISKILPSVDKVNECRAPDSCVKAGECKDGQEVWGLGCQKPKDGEPSETPYCCKRKLDA